LGLKSFSLCVFHLSLLEFCELLGLQCFCFCPCIFHLSLFKFCELFGLKSLSLSLFLCFLLFSLFSERLD
jgi:hypothetical protein